MLTSVLALSTFVLFLERRSQNIRCGVWRGVKQGSFVFFERPKFSLDTRGDL